MVSAVDRSMGLLWVFFLWSGQNCFFFPGEKHDFFSKIHGIYVFFRIIMTLDICFATINRHTMKLRLQTSWDP